MLRRIRGGVHPQDRKERTAAVAAEVLPVTGRLTVPVRQHIGDPAVPVVQVGDNVAKGQVIAKLDNGRTPPVHAPTSGRVVDISNHPDPLYGQATAVVIEADGEDRWQEGLLQHRDWNRLTAAEMVQLIFQAGVVGMGGAAFPTHMKLTPPRDKVIDTLIVNGAECEPYLTADHRTMVESPESVITGAKILMQVLNVTHCVIGIEDNKPDAIAALSRLAGQGIEVATLKTHYPQGAEKMLIWAVTGREVPSGKLPLDVGCVVQNVGTLVAVAEAVTENRPLIERVVTVSGGLVRNPKNVRARIGTSFTELVNFCGGLVEAPGKVIMGGPMMGLAQVNTQAAVIKSTSGLLFFARRDSVLPPERPCIRCGRCQAACTMRLRPNMLSILGEQGKHQTAHAEFDLMDCVECGCCVYVCPAKRNIVQYVRESKAKVALARSRAQAPVKS